ncbi:gamma-tubulin complex component 6-like [Anneissia japonica]|uniref:gamma-tubulin complex component 6-like n=1 Tax=Anneissia japonica TaxID=1529436 RepID=UPI0014257A76|nr:gamma-tubulin complex component 6-like [Anneissia japonica]
MAVCSTLWQLAVQHVWQHAARIAVSSAACMTACSTFPKPAERPYLSEAGPDALDYLYHLRKYELTLVEPSIQVQNQVELTQSDLVKDGLNILLAIPSRTFQFERETSSFHVNCNIHYKGTSPEMLSQSLAPLAEAGTQYWQLSQFAVQRSLDSMYTGGLTLQAFCSGIRTFLQLYSSRVLTVPWNSHSTISMVRHAFREFIAQLRYLWMFCMCHRRRFGRPGDPGDPLPTGIQLLSYIYQEALDCCKSQNYKVILALLRTTCGPYLMFIQDWIFNGICRDGYGEFMITANDEYLQYRDKYYWTHGYVMNTENSSSSVPMFLQELANGMYVCGKTLNLMKLCCPGHFLCNNHVPIPRLTLTFSLEELERIDKETHVYTERMHNIARRNTVSKEEKETRLEKAREDLLIQARRTAVDELNRIRGEMKQVKEAADEKKRKELKELKEQMQRDLVRRAMKIEEEKETDRKEIEEQDRIEKGIADIEGELESKARCAPFFNTLTVYFVQQRWRFIQKLLYQDIGGMERKQEAVVKSGQVYRGRGLNVVGHPSDSSAGKLLYGESNVQPLDLKVHEDAKGEIEDGLVLPLSETFKPFEDEFNQTCSLPSVDLLANAGIMPISMELGNYGISHRDTSNEAAHLLSLPAILRQSIIAPLNLAQGLRPGELFTPMVLNQILSKAIQQSLNRRSTHADKLSFSLKWLPNMFKPNAIDSLDGLELKFKIDWPCNIVITTGCLEKYNRVFSFMLQLKRASWVLRDIYFQLKRSALIHHAGNSAQFRQLQLFRHEMQHFVNVMQGYIANQVVNVSWEEFKGQLKTDVQSLDDLHNRHVEYLNKALFRCLLNKKAAPVMKIITKIFCLILKVWTQLVSSRWYYDPDIHQVVHPAFHTVRSSYSAFKEYSGFLYKGAGVVAGEMTPKGKREGKKRRGNEKGKRPPKKDRGKKRGEKR